MKPVPSNDVTIPLSAARGGNTRSADRSGGETTPNFRMAEPNGNRTSKIQSKFAAEGGEKIDANTGSPRQKATFELIVEEVDESEATTDVAAAVMDFTSPQSSALARDLVGLLQGTPETNTSDAVNVATQGASTHNNSTPDVLLGDTNSPVNVVSDEISRLAEQLSARAASLGRVPSTAAQSTPAPAQNTAENLDGNAAVSVSALQEKTGFDAPVKITSSHQTWFQSAAPVRTSLVNLTMRTESRESLLVQSNNKRSADVGADRAAPEQSADNTVEPLQTAGHREASDRGNDNPAAREGNKRGLSSEPAIGNSKAVSAASSSVSETANREVAPPYQQVRTAVAEAIVNATSLERTDYVSLYADRPTTSHLMLKTLELSLEPADLGRVTVKMNLASRDLKLEIEASKASTAQLLANDQAALKRDLLTDNSDLSTVLVSVASAVTDASSASGTGDQQFSGNSRTGNENAFTSTTSGGRDERRTPRQSDSKDSGSAGRLRDDEMSNAGAPGSGKELYI